MMHFIRTHWKIFILITAVLLATGSLFITQKKDHPTTPTIEVTRGDVQQTVSVSGFVEAKNTAQLSFPVIGTVTDIFIKEGDVVSKGDLLATLGSAKLIAQRRDAVAQLQKAQAQFSQLIEGPTSEDRAVTAASVASAKEALEKTIATEAEKVKNAKAALLSVGLQAFSENPNESATAPTITGSYTCDKEGSYTLSVYSSGSQSGASYHLSGLETDTKEVNTSQPAPFGSCGLNIQFTEGDSYINSVWTIPIPNKKSSSYITYKNAYDLALKQQEQNVQAARNALILAQKNDAAANATPSTPALNQANATIQSAQARIAQINAQIKDLSIVAPFEGVITSVNINPGEAPGTKPVITLLAQDAFELKARIPEIDITKVTLEQQAKITFDAKTDTTLLGTVSFISPLATQIDGVAYFEAIITLEKIPQWIRSGLNADIDILTQTLSNTIRIPKRYLITNQDEPMVLRSSGEDAPYTQTPVQVLLQGDNGYIAVEGLEEGDTLIAP